MNIGVGSQTPLLVGFSSESDGNDNLLTMVDPILEIGSKTYVAPKPGWTADDLREVMISERSYITWIPEKDRRFIEIGDMVWTSGRNFYVDLGVAEAFRTLQFELGAWNQFKRGQRWTVGSSSRFDELNHRIGAAAERALGKFLFDQLEKSMGAAESVFRIYKVLALPHTADRIAWRGTFYYENRDERAYKATGRTAVRRNYLPSFDIYERLVTEKREWLSQDRLSEAKLLASDWHRYAFTLHSSSTPHPSTETNLNIFHQLLRKNWLAISQGDLIDMNEGLLSE